MADSAMSDCADEAETGEEETPTDADPCVEPASHSKKEKTKKERGRCKQEGGEGNGKHA